MLKNFSNEWVRQVTVGVQTALMVLWVTFGYQPHLWAQSQHYPEWWKDRGVVEESSSQGASSANGNAHLANLGQLKWMVTQAQKELQSLLPRDANGQFLDPSWELSDLQPNLTQVKGPFDPNFPEWNLGNQRALNLGQLKAAALPFYNLLNRIQPTWVQDQLTRNALSLGSGYFQNVASTGDGHVDHGYFPWNPTTPAPQNREAATVGMLKLVFALRFRADQESGAHADGLSDLFEHAVLAAHPDFQTGGAYGPGLTTHHLTWSPGDAPFESLIPPPERIWRLLQGRQPRQFPPLFRP